MSDRPILQSALPFAPWADPRTRRLPGILPMEPGDWLRVDDAFAAQMAERDRLIVERCAAVHALSERGRAAAEELLDAVIADVTAKPGYRVTPGAITRPDGVTVAVDRAQPLLTAGRLVQEDLCLLEKAPGEDEHILTGAILCFPASWTLAEKFLKPLIAIHVPVSVYDDDIARRVQRLFDAIRPGQGLWRANALLYADPTLHHPRTEAAPRVKPVGEAPFIRSERQGLVRLPVTQAVVFSIHTYLIRKESLTPDQAQALVDFPIHRAGG
ncbi:MAG: DUF3445 domain-containing protein [Paracoccaceae bacterium]|nr:DUF3445 domain-containing protein [Paracoccaceae bacterium]MDE3237402.1 DUF3445 domain-containing protein [Paracoccaceae bacterium]